jgi:hypothetical protein
MMLVHVSTLHFKNLLLRDPVAMLRVDDQLCWTESARAKNGQVRGLGRDPFTLSSNTPSA